MTTGARRVPVTILSGALGVGKTTVLRRALTELGEAAEGGMRERVAVLVNEFGEIGIDAALLEGAGQGVVIRELAGGCMCCTLGLPMVVAVTQILARARPDRLVIEMSGLGHAGGLVDALSTPPLVEHVEVARIVTLVDPRAWERGALDREPWSMQIEAADVLVLHKIDAASERELAEARRRAEALWPPKRGILEAAHGELPLAWLLGVEAWARPTTGARPHVRPHGHGAADHEGSSFESHLDASLEDAEVSDVKIHVGHGEGYTSLGARVPPDRVIRSRLMRSWLDTLPVGSRVKAVLRLGECDDSGALLRSGWIALQVVDGVLEERETAWRSDSRLEVLVPTSTADSGVAARLTSMLSESIDAAATPER